MTKFPTKTTQFRILCYLGVIKLILLCFFFTILKNRTNIRSISIIDRVNVFIAPPVPNENTQCTVIDECTNEQREKHGNLFAEFPSYWCSCYSDFYLLAFNNHSTPVEVLMDVGANKAYAVSTWLAFFMPELDINPQRLGVYIKSKPELTEPCGSCNDCEDVPYNRTNGKQKGMLQVYGFEPQPGTVDVLKGVRDWMNISTNENLLFEIHGMAVSDRTGQVLFKKCNAGNEVCSLDVSKTKSEDQVAINSTALDDFARQKQLSKIDILKIDTEGYEPLVFRGAKTLLEQQRIRLFIFEHLTEGAWRDTSLEAEVSNLSKLGYVCYMIGKTGLIRVSFCWNDKFKVRHGNVLCVSSKDRQLWQNIEQFRLPDTYPSTCQNRSIY